MTYDDTTTPRQKARTGATLLAMGVGVAYGLRNIPPAIEGIPFVQVIPAMVLGGLLGMAVDFIGVMVAPRNDERTWTFLHLSALAIVVGVVIMGAVVRARDSVRTVIR